METEQFLTTSEAARMLNVNPSTLLEWAHKDRVPAVKTLGGHHRFPMSAIERLATTTIPRSTLVFVTVSKPVFRMLQTAAQAQGVSMADWIEQQLQREQDGALEAQQ